MEELANSFQNNYEEAQEEALNTIVNHHSVAVLNFLRGITINKCYRALGQLNQWYGIGVSHEKYMCLTVITDYISCAWSSDEFYDTFTSKNKVTSERLIFNLFDRLTAEWIKVFNNAIFKVLSKHQVESAVSLLRSSVQRFPPGSQHSMMLNGALEIGEKILTNQINRNSIENKCQEVPNVVMVSAKNDAMKLESKICKNEEKRFINKSGEKRKPDIRMYTELIPRKRSRLNLNEPVRKPLQNINNWSDEKGSCISQKSTPVDYNNAPPPKKIINAFDLLMRRKTRTSV